MRFLVFLTLILAAWATSASGQERQWRIAPAYETSQPSGQLGWSDADGEHVLYSESYAVLILQGNYRNWSSPSDAAKVSESLLVAALEKRNFHVIVWRDLISDDFQDLTRELGARFSKTKNARFFFYYFGHGATLPSGEGERREFYLVPVDAPGTAVAEDFVFNAISATSLFADFKPLNAKHAFFAFEACESGGVLQTLTGDPLPDRRGFLMSSAMNESVRQYLTAGNAVQLVPATNTFTNVLVDGLSSASADSNKDLYISGNEMMTYVSGTLPNINGEIYPLSPEMGSSGSGNFVFGPIDPANPTPRLEGALNEGASSPQTVLPMFKGMVSPGDVYNDQVIAFLASNRNRDVYVNLLVDESMIMLGEQINSYCRTQLALPSRDDEWGDPDATFPVWNMPLPKLRSSSTIYALDATVDVFTEAGDINTEAIDCSTKLTFQLTTEPRSIGCGSNCLYYRVDGVFRNEMAPLGSSGTQYMLSEVAVGGERLRSMKMALDKDFPEPFAPFEADP